MTCDITEELASGTAAISGQQSGAVQITRVGEQSQWDELCQRAPSPHLPQSWAYGEAKAAGRWTVQRVAFHQGARILAIATLLQLRLFGVTLLTRINRGPLFLSDEAEPAEVLAVYRAVRNKWGRFYQGALLLAPALEAREESTSLLRKAGFRLRHPTGWRSGRVDLRQDLPSLWSSFSSTFRNRFRNAEKAGATLRVSDDDASYDWMVARHLENMEQKGFKAADADFLMTLRTAAPGSVIVFQVMQGSEPVAGMSVVRFGDRCEYHVGWFGEAGRKLNAGNFLMWNIVSEMKARGCVEFDVGGLSDGNGYTQFKRTMNPREFALAGEWFSI